MKQYIQIVFKGFLMPVLLGAGLNLSAQETRTYREEFKVGPEVIVEVSTSYADIEFETWSKNEVEVEAIITLEGATPEEANAFFDQPRVDIVGNSSKVSIRTGGRGSNSLFASSDMDFGDLDFHFEMPDIPPIPEMPELAPMVEDIIASIPEIAAMPPMPPMPDADFDYEAFEKDGQKYIEKWQKKFEKEFDEEYRAEFEAWGREMGEEMEARIEAREAAREAMKEQRDRQRAEMQEQREEIQEQMREQREEMREQQMEAREQARMAQRQAREAQAQVRNNQNPGIFYMRGASGNQKFTIKKTIKVKMPKGARLKMNVRYGEVKLADNALNTKANLSYASLFANTIDGRDTDIAARYSPVTVERWNGGRLQTEFSDGVELHEVGQLNMVSRSSMVTIDRLLREVSIDSRMGLLVIGGVADDFRDMDISVAYGELRFDLPRSAYEITVSEDRSEVLYPDFIRWEASQGERPQVRKGFSQQKGSGKSILINTAYSEVSLND